MKIIYASDIHTHRDHLFSLLSIAQTQAVEGIIIGGDMVPHHLPDSYPADPVQAQGLYLKKVFIPAVEAFKRKQDIALYLDLSNDDFIFNRKLLEDRDGELFHLLHLRKHALTHALDIIGYMNVPPTPFQRKDWEKPDSPESPFARDNRVLLSGYTSKTGKLEKTAIDLSSTDTIESDLARLSALIDRPFIFVSHCPPCQTPLDMLFNGQHAGSSAIRRFIEKWSAKGRLIASLHGHIHESPSRSGSISTKIGNTLCINPGQNGKEDGALRYVVLDLAETQTPPAVRIVNDSGTAACLNLQ